MYKYISIAVLSVAAITGCGEQKVETQQNQQAEAEKMTQESQPELMVADAAHNARNSLDWNGIYKGSVPCADCAGTQLLVELNADGNYLLSRSYTDKVSAAVMEEGQFTWNDTNSIIQVGEYHFFVGENVLILVDQDGKRIEDDQMQQFVLTKEMAQ
ncbi:copper resistance protein NlpE [Vibrio sp.]|uniref:copper resistance protein NlpE n=1 Tax=Vibrio sp. TaxID=678 RepID=UPI003D1278A8